MLSSCNIVGFFCLARGNRVCVHAARQICPLPNNPKGFYAFYDTSLSCKNGTLLTAVVRYSCPPPNSILPDGAVAFITGSVYIPPDGGVSLIEAKHMALIPGEISSPTYQTLVPPFLYSHVNCVGTVCGPSYSLPDRSIVVPICVSETVHGEKHSFQLMYVLLNHLKSLFSSCRVHIGVFFPGTFHAGPLRHCQNRAQLFKSLDCVPVFCHAVCSPLWWTKLRSILF